MPKPSEVYYQTTKEAIIQNLHDQGYAIVAFRQPLDDETYLAAPRGDAVMPGLVNVTFHGGIRLILRRLQ